MFRSLSGYSRVAVRLGVRPGLQRVFIRGMAQDLKTLKSRMHVVSTIGKATKAMKMVAAAKVTGLQRNLAVVRDFQSGVSEQFVAPELPASAVTSRALVPVTSDRGLCGSINVLVSRRIRQIFTEDPKAAAYALIPVGLKARAALERRYRKQFRAGVSDYGKLKELSFRQIIMISDKLIGLNIDEMTFLYNKFKNIITSVQTEEKLYAPKLLAANSSAINAKYTVESAGYKHILQDFYEFRFAVRLHHMFTENMIAEMSSRMNAMSNSTKAAGEMFAALELLYNRTRQAKITNELIEVVSGSVVQEDLADDD